MSNFSISLMERARTYLSTTDIVVNQIKYSLLNRQAEKETIPYCQREKIIVMAYTPLERGEVLHIDVVQKLAEKYKKSPAQIALNWLISKPLIVAYQNLRKRST